MEVHHHPDLHHKPKKFKEYFLEFLMIFLAVTLGFFAENIREGSTNKETEKRNIEIIINNLKDDILHLQQVIDKNQERVKVLDTLLTFQNIINTDTIYSKRFYSLFLRSAGAFFFSSNDAAIEQMKASGSLRLVKNKLVLDSIFYYGYITKSIYFNQHYCEIWSNAALQNASKCMNFQIALGEAEFPSTNKAVNLKRSANDEKDILLEFYNDEAALKKILSDFYLPFLITQKANGSSLINLLNNEYHLRNE
jgi:hypothetical protein